MKKAFILGVTLILGVTPSYADVYVKVDAQGNAIGGAISCGADVCGDSNSVYSKLTLQEGERYVLQGLGDTGIGNNNPNTQVKVDLETNDWTVTKTTTVTLPEPISIGNTEIVSFETKSIEQFNPKGEVVNPIIRTPILITNETNTVSVSDTATVSSDTFTATVSVESVNTVESAIAYIRLLINQIYAILGRLGIKG